MYFITTGKTGNCCIVQRSFQTEKEIIDWVREGGAADYTPSGPIIAHKCEDSFEVKTNISFESVNAKSKKKVKAA